MGCTRCGTDAKLVELMFNKLMQEALKDGTLQAGLVDCEKDRLEKNTKVVKCDTLKDTICQLIENGDLCINEPVTIHYDASKGKLQLGMKNGEVLETDLNVPTANDFLAKITVDDKGVATFEISNGKKLTLDIGKQIKVKAQKAQDGTVTITNQDGSTVTIPAGRDGARGPQGPKGDKGDAGPRGPQGPAGAKGADGALDCNAIAQLPLAQWKKGTSILASQDGACKRLVPVENLFQEIGVAMHANKLSGLTKETYHVVVTVTNSGEAVNEVTDLVITKPLLGSYTLSNFTNSKSAGVTVEKLTDLTYKIKKLNSGGTAKVEFDVVPTSVGTFQFGASVNPNTTLDLQANNNQASITLSATTTTDPNYVPSVDCPAVEIKYGNTVLYQDETSSNVMTIKRSNLFIEKTAGELVLTTKNISTVYIMRSNHITCNNFLKNSTNTKIIRRDPHVNAEDRYVTATRKLTSERAFTNYTFTNNTLKINSINDVIDGLTLFVRPKGMNCRWQVYHLIFGRPLTTEKLGLTVTGLATSLYKKTNKDLLHDKEVTALSTYTETNNLIIGTSTGEVYSCSTSGVLHVEEFVEINLQSGTAYNFTITGVRDRITTKGATAVTPTNDGVSVKVSASAKQTDSLAFDNVKINIKE